MKLIKTLLFTIIALFSLSAMADIGVQTDNGDSQAFSDPNLKEDAQQDLQNDRNALQVDSEFDDQNRSSADAAGDGRSDSAGGRR